MEGGRASSAGREAEKISALFLSGEDGISRVQFCWVYFLLLPAIGNKKDKPNWGVFVLLEREREKGGEAGLDTRRFWSSIEVGKL